MAEQSLKDKTAKGILWGGLSNGMMQLLNAVFGIVIAKILSPAEYGVVGMIAIFSTLAGSLQEGGFISALTNRKNASKLDFDSVFAFNVSVSLLLYCILWIAAPTIAGFFHEPVLIPLSRYAFTGFVVASLSVVPRAILFRQMKVKEQSIISIVSLLISGVTGVIMALSGASYWGIATQPIVYVSGVTVMSWYVSGYRPSLHISLLPIKEMFGFSSKLIITNIFTAINNNVFSIILGRYYSKQEVGEYNQANKWNLMGSQLISGMVQGVAQPMFVQVSDDDQRLRRVFRKMLRFTALISFPLMLGLSLVAEDFIVMLIGEKWVSSSHILSVLCIAGMFMPIQTLYSNFIISRGKSNVNMMNTISMGLAILAMLYVEGKYKVSLFSLHGVELMVVSFVIIYVSWLLIWHYFVWREIKLPFLAAMKDTLPFLVVALASMTASYYAGAGMVNIYLRFATRVLVEAGVYIVILYLSGAKILRESLQYLRHKKKKEQA